MANVQRSISTSLCTPNYLSKPNVQSTSSESMQSDGINASADLHRVVNAAAGPMQSGSAKFTTAKSK